MVSHRDHTAFLFACDSRRIFRYTSRQSQFWNRVRVDRLVGGADSADASVRGTTVVRDLSDPRAGRMVATPRARATARRRETLHARISMASHFQKHLAAERLVSRGRTLLRRDFDDARCQRARTCHFCDGCARDEFAVRTTHVLPIPVPGRRVHWIVYAARAD